MFLLFRLSATVLFEPLTLLMEQALLFCWLEVSVTLTVEVSGTLYRLSRGLYCIDAIYCALSDSGRRCLLQPSHSVVSLIFCCIPFELLV